MYPGDNNLNNYDHKVEENINSIVKDLIDFVNDSGPDSSDDESEDYEIIQEKTHHSCDNPEMSNNELILGEGSFLSKSMDSINDMSITKGNLKLDKNEENDSQESSLIFYNQDGNIKNKMKNLRNPTKKFSRIVKFEQDSHDNSLVDDIKVIPSQKPSGKSNFFQQKEKQNEEFGSSCFIPKTFKKTDSSNITYKDEFNKNNSISIQDQFVSFNSDFDGYNNSSMINQSLFNNSNSQIDKQKIQKNFCFQNLNNNSNIIHSYANSSLNLNSTNQSNKKSNFYSIENISKDQNLSRLSFNK